MLFADMLSLHLLTFLMLFVLVHVASFSSRCMLELRFAIYHWAARLSTQASNAVLAEESLTRPGSLQTLSAHQLALFPGSPTHEQKFGERGRARDILSAASWDVQMAVQIMTSLKTGQIETLLQVSMEHSWHLLFEETAKVWLLLVSVQLTVERSMSRPRLHISTHVQ